MLSGHRASAVSAGGGEPDDAGPASLAPTSAERGKTTRSMSTGMNTVR